MIPPFDPHTRSYRDRSTRFLIRLSIAGVVIVAAAVWIGGKL